MAPRNVHFMMPAGIQYTLSRVAKQEEKSNTFSCFDHANFNSRLISRNVCVVRSIVECCLRTCLSSPWECRMQAKHFCRIWDSGSGDSPVKLNDPSFPFARRKPCFEFSTQFMQHGYALCIHRYERIVRNFGSGSPVHPETSHTCVSFFLSRLGSAAAGRRRRADACKRTQRSFDARLFAATLLDRSSTLQFDSDRRRIAMT